MKNIRINNTIQLRWSIYETTAGEPVPYNLGGRPIKVYLQGLFKPDIEVTDFGISDNVLSLTFEGKDQKVLGPYTLLLVENQGAEGMRAVDYCKAFTLVPHTQDAAEGEAVSNLEVITLDLATTVDFGSGGGSITIDSQLSETSKNAVQNKVVTAALKEKQPVITDLDAIREGARKGATAVQASTLAKVATSGSYFDLNNKPTIPSAVTESTVSGWGFTKNTGTYNKPSSGIPKTDLASSVQTSLGKADTALQQHQDISGKQDEIGDLSDIRQGAADGKSALSKIGNTNNLETTNKVLVDAINEVLAKANAGGGSSSSGEGGAVSVREVTAGSGYLQTFQVLQNGSVVGTINITKELKSKVITADMLADGVVVSGPQGEKGDDGVGVTSVEQTTASDADGGENVITVTLSNGATSTFKVKNGSKGSQGIQGEQGPVGPQGPEGPQGPKGDGADIDTSEFLRYEDANSEVEDVEPLPEKTRSIWKGSSTPAGGGKDWALTEPLVKDAKYLLEFTTYVDGSDWSDNGVETRLIILSENKRIVIPAGHLEGEVYEDYAAIYMNIGDSTIRVFSDLDDPLPQYRLTNVYRLDNYITHVEVEGEFLVEFTDSAIELQPNKMYKTGEIASLTITLATPVTSEIVNHYMFQFTSGAIPTTLSLPATINWYNGAAPEIEANMVYQISILDGLGIFSSYPLNA